MLAVGLALLLTACGGATVSTSSPAASPSPTATRREMRDLRSGERISLANGLSVTVPAGYKGWYFSSTPPLEGELDVVASNSLAQTSLMHSFSVRSLGSSPVSIGRSWPLVASSEDGTVEVHAFVVRSGTPKAVSMASIIVKLPGRPLGQVSLSVFGKKASAEPAIVLRRAGWLGQW